MIDTEAVISALGAGVVPTRVHPESEITRDPIFLFQRRRWTLVREPPGWAWEDGALCPEQCEHEDDSEDCSLSRYDTLRERFPEDIIAWWDTELVFFTREEGEAYGRAKEYNYVDGWRVYCVCAQGKLAELLRAVTTRDDDP